MHVKRLDGLSNTILESCILIYTCISVYSMDLIRGQYNDPHAYDIHGYSNDMVCAKILRLQQMVYMQTLQFVLGLQIHGGGPYSFNKK